MSFMSIRARRRLGELGLAALIIALAWLMQMTLLTKLSFNTILCSLPLTVTIIWGSVFGSPLKAQTADELKIRTLGEAIGYQVLSGSLSGAIVGALFASLYATLLPVYPVSYPLVGWIAGYFSLKSFNRATLLCIPIVLGGTVFAESILAMQLTIMGRPDVLQRLVEIAFPEAILNSLIAPFLYFPMRGWFEFFNAQKVRE